MTGTLFSQNAQVAVKRGRTAPLEEVRMTLREREVIALIAVGMSNKEIAQHLSIATDTVKSHVRNVMEKPELCTRACRSPPTRTARTTSGTGSSGAPAHFNS
jgi:ATP/maltotriose-dependent transcriptional regulator MalT